MYVAEKITLTFGLPSCTKFTSRGNIYFYHVQTTITLGTNCFISISESMPREPRLCCSSIPRRAPVRGHRVQDREPWVGVLVQARLPLPLPQQHLPAVVPLQALPVPPVDCWRYYNILWIKCKILFHLLKQDTLVK